MPTVPPVPGRARDTTSVASAGLVSARATLDVIKRNADTLLERIGQLLSASASEARAPHTTRIDLTDFTADTVTKHLPAAAAASVDLRTITNEPDTPAIVSLDTAMIEQVLDNLISNAIKYTPPGGSVQIQSAVDEAGAITISVVDTGVGMSPSECRHAFDKFFRSASAVKSATQGIGLGLAISKAIIAAHNGHIELTSAPGQGTTATITLPAPEYVQGLGHSTE